MNIRPLHDRIVVSQLESEQTTASGIVIPDNAQEKPQRGKVVAIGKGKALENGNTRSLDVKVNDIVIFGKYSGTEIKVGAEKFLIMREEDLLAVVEE